MQEELRAKITDAFARAAQLYDQSAACIERALGLIDVARNMRHTVRLQRELRRIERIRSEAGLPPLPTA